MTLPSSCRKCGQVGKSLCDRCKSIQDQSKLAVLSSRHNNEYNTHDYRANRQTLIKITWENHIPCWLCGLPFANRSDISADHYILLSHHGTSDLDNLRPAHKSCNTHRGNRDPWLES